MNSRVEVIVVACVGDRTYGDRLVDEEVGTLEEGLRLGATYLAERKAVIVRPLYNESDEEGVFFREWRSFGGEPLREVRWRL